MSSDDKRVREFAYQIWESEGKPEGQEARHWEMARKLAEAESMVPNKQSKASTTKAKPETKAKAKAKAPAATSVVTPPDEKKAAAAKKPRAPRKPSAS